MFRKISLVFLTLAIAFSVFAGIAQAGGSKTVICHKPGTPAEGIIEVSDSAVPAHLDHGDSLGTCGAVIANTCPFDIQGVLLEEDESVTL